MFNFNHYVHLRYVLLINIFISLVPSMGVKGRANDPLRHASWWTFDQHSAVMVVAAAAILGTAIAFAITRMNGHRWWAFIGCGIFVGVFPAIFYQLTAPDGDVANLPLVGMYGVGAICGVIGGFVLSSVLGRKKQSSAAAQTRA